LEEREIDTIFRIVNAEMCVEDSMKENKCWEIRTYWGK
jgi:hypothetical protein